MRFGYDIYCHNENLVLWAGSGNIGCAVIQQSGIMEYRRSAAGGLEFWNNGLSGIRSDIMKITWIF